MAPNSESDDPSEYNAAFNETVDLDFGLTVFFTVLFIFFLALLMRTELKTKLTEAKRKPQNQIFSTFNILLLSMIIANCLSISFEYVYANNNDYNIAALSSSIIACNPKHLEPWPIRDPRNDSSFCAICKTIPRVIWDASSLSD
ncbi:hypothetical protein HDU99_006715, partial [Rhizoclosmatium hyalinum]